MSNIDSKIVAALAVVKTRREEVEALDLEISRGWETTCSYTPSNGTAPLNIQTSNKQRVIDIGMDVLHRSTLQTQACARLGLTEPETKIQGFTVDAWFQDLKKQMAKIHIRAKKDELAEMEKRLDMIVSPEQRRAMELAEIEKSLGI